MAVGPDSVDFLRQFVVRDMELVQNVITVFGVYYIGKNLLILGKDLFVGFRNFVWARLRRVNYVKEYGPWAVVTGATDGIGKEYARQLALRGMKVVLISRTEEKLLQVAKALKEETASEVTYVVADFSKGREVFPNIERALKNLDIGILVNNVGVINPGYPMFSDMVEDEIRQMLEVNNNTLVAMTHLVLPGMMDRRRGAIVNLSSSSGAYPTPLMALYSSSKAFVSHFSKSISYEAANYGVTVQSVVPFYVKTPMTAGVSAAFRNPLSTLFYPDADSFVRSAVATIPYAKETTGFWLHAIQSKVLTFFGATMWALGALRHNAKLGALYNLKR